MALESQKEDNLSTKDTTAKFILSPTCPGFYLEVPLYMHKYLQGKSVPLSMLQKNACAGPVLVNSAVAVFPLTVIPSLMK